MHNKAKIMSGDSVGAYRKTYISILTKSCVYESEIFNGKTIYLYIQLLYIHKLNKVY